MKREIQLYLMPFILILLVFLLPFGIGSYRYSTSEAVNQFLGAPIWMYYLNGPFAGSLDFDLHLIYHTSTRWIPHLFLAVVTSVHYVGGIKREYVILSALVPLTVLLLLSNFSGPFLTIPVPLIILIVVLLVIIFPAKN